MGTSGTLQICKLSLTYWAQKHVRGTLKVNVNVYFVEMFSFIFSDTI